MQRLPIALISVDDSSCLLVFTYGFHAVNFLLPSHHSARRALEAAFGIVICPWLELGSAFELHRVRTILSRTVLFHYLISLAAPTGSIGF